jgi:hypothetical protein
MWQRKRLVAGLCVRASGKIRLERATQKQTMAVVAGKKVLSFLFQAFAKTETVGAYAIVCVTRH